MQIRKLRTKQRMSQETLAGLSGLSQRYIGGIERGTENFTVESLEKIANALNAMLKISLEKNQPSE